MSRRCSVGASSRGSIALAVVIIDRILSTKHFPECPISSSACDNQHLA
jgi:hypothetical protein